ncbi:protein lifeguard 1-like [Uranotaenia lowii]|uniref:protein lifeguard 1-like n=1 Tax=Uranotaenia lowii TaxID=190385 RepID=UPI00247855BC|nr:protein lifeguard 1-like [Uranotaenia lowii]
MSYYPPHHPGYPGGGTPLPHNPHEGPISHTVFPPEMNPNYPHRPLGSGPYPPGSQYPPPHLMPPPFPDDPNYPHYPHNPHYPPHHPQYPPGHYPPGHPNYPGGHYPYDQQAVAFGGQTAANQQRKTEEKKE